MANLIIGYPDISAADFEWIQAIREQHDPMYFNVVRPHITFVFSTSKLSSDRLLVHAKGRLSGFKKISLKFDTAKVVEDDSKKFYQAFLIPSVGYDDITRCHDLLYTGELADELRADIPFVPHIGIGTSTDKSEMDTLVDWILGEGIDISGSLNELSIVQYDGTKVLDLDTLSLG